MERRPGRGTTQFRPGVQTGDLPGTLHARTAPRHHASRRSSTHSNVSIGAADIALAFKNVKFNKNDLKLIKEAYNQCMKNHVRKRIEKRRNLKLFSKGYRQRLGEDSVVQGSDSSISSDDCRSSRTILHKDNIPKSINRTLTTYDLTQFRASMKKNDLYKDCTENLKQNYHRNMFTVNSLKHTTSYTPQEKDENTSVVTLKKRFAKGASFQWPAQRFNKSKVISNETSATNVLTEIPRNKNNLHTQTESTKAFDTDSEEEIFSQSTVKANSTHQRTMQQKRVLEDEESNSSNRKRSKTAISPIKENDSLSNNINIQNNDFNFRKTKIPVRKISNVKKDSVPEILIAKSRLPLTGNLELDLPYNNNKSDQNNNFNEQNSVGQNKKLLQKTAELIEPDCSNHTEVTQNTTDVSMSPSYLKRKFAESKNISSDNLATNSPQTKIYNTCREKNKERNIVSSQSCLSRDVLGMTNAANKKELSKNNIDKNDKWDVASDLSMCNSDEGSNTYTDEEIFKVPQISNKNNTKRVNKKVDKPTAVKNKITEIKKPQPTINNTIKLNYDCKVVVKKKETNACSSKNDAPKSECPNKRTVSDCVKSFWDTDYESDMEELNVTPWTSKYQVKQGEIKKPQPTINNTIKLNNDCKVVVKKKETNACSSKNDAPKSECPNKRTVSDCVKSFWDTDYESDMEELNVTPWTSKYQVKQGEIKKPQPTINNTIKLNNDCKVVVKKKETNACSSKNDAPKSECPNKRTVSNCVKSIWDTDYESDMKERTVTPWTSKYQVKQGEIKKPQPTINNTIKLKDCKVVLKKMETNACSSKNDAPKSECRNKRTVSNCVKSICEERTVTPRTSKYQVKQGEIKKPQPTINNTIKLKDCKVVLKKMETNACSSKNDAPKSECRNKRTVSNCVKSICEERTVTPRTSKYQVKQGEIKKPQPTINNTIKLKDCKVVLKKMETNACSSKNDAPKSECRNKRTVSNCVKSICEERTVTPRTSKYQVKQGEIKKPQPTINNTIKLKDCKVVLKKMETNACSSKNDAPKSECRNKRTVSNCVKPFRDTDYESDMEERTVTPWTSKYQVKQGEIKKPQTTINNTIKLNYDCKVVVKKMETNACSSKNDAPKSECRNKRTVSNCVKPFRDTDYESDMEERTVTPWTSKYQVKQGEIKKPQTKINNSIKLKYYCKVVVKKNGD